MKRIMQNKFFWLFLVVLFALPVLPQPIHVPEYWVTLLNYIGLYSIVAIGLVLLTGIGGMTSFGQAAFVGIGAYATAYLTTRYGVSPWLALIAGVVVTALIALMLGLVTMRLSGHFLPLGTIAWGLALFYLFGNLDMLGKYDGINGIPVLNVFGINLESGRHIYYLIWVVVLGAVISVQNLLNSRPGRAIRALRGGGMMAEAMGVNTGWMRVVIFVYAAVLASVSGFLYAHLQRAVNPTPFGLNHGIEFLFMAVVGGVSHVWGAVLGAAILTVLQDYLQTLLPKLLGENGNFEVIVFGILMVLLLQYARQGVWPFVARFFPKGPRAHLADHAEPLPQRSKPEAGEDLLTVNKARKQFGGLVAVNDVSFEVKAGQIIGLIGPNGAGKSTTFNLVTGVLQATSGEIKFRGERIDSLFRTRKYGSINCGDPRAGRHHHRRDLRAARARAGVGVLRDAGDLHPAGGVCFVRRADARRATDTEISCHLLAADGDGRGLLRRRGSGAGTPSRAAPACGAHAGHAGRQIPAVSDRGLRAHAGRFHAYAADDRADRVDAADRDSDGTVCLPACV